MFYILDKYLDEYLTNPQYIIQKNLYIRFITDLMYFQQVICYLLLQNLPCFGHQGHLRFFSCFKSTLLISKTCIYVHRNTQIHTFSSKMTSLMPETKAIFSCQKAELQDWLWQCLLRGDRARCCSYSQVVSIIYQRRKTLVDVQSGKTYLRHYLSLRHYWELLLG